MLRSEVGIMGDEQYNLGLDERWRLVLCGCLDGGGVMVRGVDWGHEAYAVF